MCVSARWAFLKDLAFLSPRRAIGKRKDGEEKEECSHQQAALKILARMSWSELSIAPSADRGPQRATRCLLYVQVAGEGGKAVWPASRGGQAGTPGDGGPSVSCRLTLASVLTAQQEGADLVSQCDFAPNCHVLGLLCKGEIRRRM